jgi:hypothetical protein
VLQYIGLTAGEAFIVLFVAGFIITWPYWPRVGAWLGERFVSGRVGVSPDK